MSIPCGMDIFLCEQTKLLQNVWLPNWHAAFVRGDGLFHEQLAADSDAPVDVGHIRLITQARQIFTYTVAGDGGQAFGATLEQAFDTLLRKYRYADGFDGFAYALKTDGTLKEGWFDTYGQAFAIYACLNYYKASGDPKACKQARATLDMLDQYARVPDGRGLYEALDEKGKPIAKIRRQNPHMHLLEACLLGYELTRDARYAEWATELYDLFRTVFCRQTPDGDGLMLVEFFTDDLKTPHGQDGYKIEGGHHHEWVWLLDRYRHIIADSDETRHFQKALYQTAQRLGHDHDQGGIFDVVDARDGAPLVATKRIWPVTEAMKSVAIAQRDGYALDREVHAIQDLWRAYLPANGVWIERMTRDMQETGAPRPASTPYHVIGGLRENCCAATQESRRMA